MPAGFFSLMRCHLIPSLNFTETQTASTRWMRLNEISSTDWLAPSTQQNKKKFCISISISSKSEKTTTVLGTSFTTSLHLLQYRADQNLPRRRQLFLFWIYNLYPSPIRLDHHKWIDNKFHLFLGKYKLSWQLKIFTRFLFNWIFIFARFCFCRSFLFKLFHSCHLAVNEYLVDLSSARCRCPHLKKNIQMIHKKFPEYLLQPQTLFIWSPLINDQLGWIWFRTRYLKY